MSKSDRIKKRQTRRHGKPSAPRVIGANDNIATANDNLPAVEVRGSMTPEQKEERLTAFSTGAVRIIITKPSVAGFGLNWQHCARCGPLFEGEKGS